MARRSDERIDTHLGKRLRDRRVMMGLSQQELADRLGLSYQQTHKYERGVNRISAARLLQLAQVLRVPIMYFYEGLDAPIVEPATEGQRMVIDMTRNFANITNYEHRRAICGLVRALAEQN